MKSKKQLQLGETIKRAMSDIFLRDNILNIAGSYVTILEADVSPDAKNVKIFIDIFGNESNHAKIIDKLNQAAPHFRFQLAKKLAVRMMPEITFILDETGKNVKKIEEIIAKEEEKFGGKK